jgi:hypothetical protein
MEALYPPHPKVDLIRRLAIGSIAAQLIWLLIVRGNPGGLSALAPATKRARRTGR